MIFCLPIFSTEGVINNKLIIGKIEFFQILEQEYIFKLYGLFLKTKELKIYLKLYIVY